MQLKCIGGPLTGKYIAVENMKSMALKVPVLSESGFSIAEATVSFTVREYTKREVITLGGRIEYLAPSDWSDFQALSHVLT